MPTVRASAVIAAPAEKVWTAIRDFGSHAAWIHSVTSIDLLGGTGTTIGVVRRVTFADGSVLNEVLSALDDVSHTQSYRLTGDTPWRISNVLGHIRLRSVTANDVTLIERIVVFDSDLSPADLKELTESFRRSLATSLDLLSASLE